MKLNLPPSRTSSSLFFITLLLSGAVNAGINVTGDTDPTAESWADGTVDDNAYLGDHGVGSLTLDAGSTLSMAGLVHIGESVGSSGTATITDPGSVWSTSGLLMIGNYGAGSLTVSQGARVNVDQYAFMGYRAGGTGTATVSGSGSLLSVGDTLWVGYDGTGSLLIQAGGKVTDYTSYIGAASVTVDGTDSSWINTFLYVGRSTTGTLTISNGGSVTAPYTYIGTSARYFQGEGTLNIGNYDLTSTAGTLNAGTVTFNKETGAVLNFNQTDSTVFSANIESITDYFGTLNQRGSGTTILTGINTYQGTTNITNGTLQIGNGGTTGSLGVDDVVNNSVLSFNRSDSASVGNTISGSGTVTQAGGGILTLSAVNTYSGATRITAGTLLISGGINNSTAIAAENGSIQLAVGNVLKDSADISLKNASLLAGGSSETTGTVSLLGGSNVIRLDNASSLLHFADSSAAAWTGTLAIQSWSGSSAGGGTDQIYFGSSTGGLTPDQLAKISFTDPTVGGVPQTGSFGAVLLPSGELVAIPEPGTSLLLLGSALTLAFRRSRKALPGEMG